MQALGEESRPRGAPPGSATGIMAAALDLVSAALIAILIAAAMPLTWETNDDVGMAMWAHGWGEVSRPTAHLVYSNVLWGALLGRLPTIAGILPYAWLHLALLAVALWAVLRALRCAGLPTGLRIALVALIAIRPLHLMQFSTLAGMLTLAGMSTLLAQRDAPPHRELALASALVLLGYLIRPEACAVVGLVALPLLATRTYLADRRAWSWAAGLAVLVALVTHLDMRHYSGPDWQDFHAVSAVRQWFIDFPVQGRIPDLDGALRRVGLSQNDLLLFSSWFQNDPKVANVAALSTLVAESRSEGWWLRAVGHGLPGLLDIVHLEVVTLVAMAAGLTWLAPARWRLVLAWLVLLALLLLFGCLERSGIVRIYYAGVCLLLVAGAMAASGSLRDGVGHFVAGCAVLAAVASMIGYLHMSRSYLTDVARAQADVAELDRTRLHIVWGSSFPYEHAYPPLADPSRVGTVRLYSLGTTSLAPPMLAQLPEARATALVDLLLGNEPVPVITTAGTLRMLATYCTEHYSRNLTVERTQELRVFQVYFVNCR